MKISRNRPTRFLHPTGYRMCMRTSHCSDHCTFLFNFLEFSIIPTNVFNENVNLGPVYSKGPNSRVDPNKRVGTK